MGVINKVRIKLNTFLDTITTLLFIGLVIIVGTQVFYRYILSSSIPWSEELARFAFVWITFLGAEMTLRKKGHIAFDSVYKSLSKNLRFGMAVIIDLVIITFAILLFISGWTLVETGMNRPSSALGVSMGWVYIIIPITMIFMIINTVHSLLEKISLFLRKEPWQEKEVE